MYLLKAYFTVNSLLLEGCSPGKLEAVELNFMASLECWRASKNMEKEASSSSWATERKKAMGER